MKNSGLINTLQTTLEELAESENQELLLEKHFILQLLMSRIIPLGWRE